MVIFLNDNFPNLRGSTRDTKDFDLYDYLGDSWGLILMHPGDFTPVCTTELGELAMMYLEFKNRGVKLCGFSCDSRRQHKLWIRDIKYVTGADVQFPLFCDPTRVHAMSMGVLDKNHLDGEGRPLSVRGVYVLYPKTHDVAMMTVYPNSTGRDMDEILRAVDALQLSYQHPVVTPKGWRPGEDVIVNADLSDGEAESKFGNAETGYRVMEVPSEAEQNGTMKQHYMRFAKDPSPSHEKENRK